MSNRWIMIQNPGEVPLWGIRLLGLSQKTDEQIGRFGSGLKEAIALLTRLNVPIVICSGETTVTFSVENNGGHDEIGFTLDKNIDRYKNGTWYGLGLHPHFGRHDWVDPWQALREVVCNALDEGPDMMHREIVAQIEPRAACTRVYIGAKTEVLKAYDTLDRKLLMLGNHEPLLTVRCGRVYSKIGLGERAQIYHRGVWVCEYAKKSIYDYELKDLRLTESRTSSIGSIVSELSDIIENMTSTLLAPIVELMATAVYEKNIWHEYAESRAHYGLMYNRIGNKPAGWRGAFHHIHGPNSVACLTDDRMIERIKAVGLTPVPFREDHFRIFKAAGVRTHETVLNPNDIEGIEIVEDEEAGKRPIKKKADVVWDALKGIGVVSGKRPSILIFRESPGSAMHRNGFVRDGKVYINDNVVGSREETLTLIEEFAHEASGAGDESRAFQDWLIDVIERALFK